MLNEAEGFPAKRDALLASERLYKVAEETVKALAAE